MAMMNIFMDISLALIDLIQFDLQILVDELIPIQQFVESRYRPLLIITVTKHSII